MKLGIRKWLEPGEELLFDSRPKMIGPAGITAVAIALGSSIGVAIMVSAYLNKAAGDGAAVSLGDQLAAMLLTGSLSFVILLNFWFLSLAPVGVLLTDRRVIRTTGRYYWPLESLAYTDIAEVRSHRGRLTLVAKGPDALRRLARNGDSVPAGDDRISAELPRWKFPGFRESRHEKALRFVGGEPLRWRAPELPADVRWMIRLEWIFIGVTIGGGGGLFLLLMAQTASSPAAKPGLVVGMALLCLFFLFEILFFRHAHLWLAARLLSPDCAVMFLRATASRDWPGAAWGPRPGLWGRLTSPERQARFLSRLLGHPVRLDDTPGPEAFGGGWVK